MDGLVWRDVGWPALLLLLLLLCCENAEKFPLPHTTTDSALQSAACGKAILGTCTNASQNALLQNHFIADGDGRLFDEFLWQSVYGAVQHHRIDNDGALVIKRLTALL